MSRRSSSLNRIDSGISRHLGNQYAEVLKVANNIDAVVKAASVDLEALALALEEATDFEGISVVSGSVAGWDPVTKVITVPTIKGDTGEDLSLISIEDNGSGVFTWNFSDGTVFQTPSLTGPRGLQGIQGPQGEKGDFVALVNVTHQGNGIFKWTFDDGSSYTTPSLTGPQGLKGDKGDKGDKGKDLTIEQIVSNVDGTFIWQFSDGTTYTTPNLKGPQGVKGEQGSKGDQGVSVHHLRATSTTDPEGDYGTFGELDTYTFYSDADETNVLGWFSVRNGIGSNELEPLGIMRTTTYDTNYSGVVDNSEKLEGASLADVQSFVTDRTGDTSLLNTAAEDLTGAVNEVRSTLNNLDDHVASEVTRLDQRVDTEQSEREQDVLTLNTRVDTEVSTLDTRIDTEVSTLNTRITGEVSTLNARVDTEVAALDDDVTDLNDRVDTVEAAAVQESLNINTRITNEVSTLNTRVDTEVSTLNTRITSEVSDINSGLSALTADKYDKTGGHISGDVSISGKLTVQGGMAEVEAERVSTSDTIVRLNDGEVGAGVTNGFAGIEIDRGTETDYEFGFNETTELFEVGKVGDRQPLLTRMLSPVANKFFRWNDTTKQAETADVTWGDVTGKLSDVSKTEAETGAATTSRFWSSLRVREAILGWWNSSASKTKLDGIETGAQVNVATNIAQGTRTTTTVPITSSTGSGATLSAASTSLAGVMTSADKTKLDGIAVGAQVNSVTSVAGKTGAVTLAKDDVGLSNVDNVQQAPITRTITAGTGLTGGGNLTADRTLTLGTPSTLSGNTTNGVTDTSHTHAISSTASRTDTSTATLLQAKAMNDHRTSGDHDARYLQPNGNGSGLTNLNAGNLSSGTVPTARLPKASTTSDGIMSKEDKSGLDLLIDQSLYFDPEVSWFTYDRATDTYLDTSQVKVTSVHKGMRRCLVLDDGTINYFLDPDNSALKEDGTPSVLTGADGQVMVTVPRFYCARTVKGTVETWIMSAYPRRGLQLHPAFIVNGSETGILYGAYPAVVQTSGGSLTAGLNLDNNDARISTGTDKLASLKGSYAMVGLTRPQFRMLAGNRGASWTLVDWLSWQAVAFLLYTEYGNLNSQTVTGAGNIYRSYPDSSSVQSDSPHTVTGVSDPYGNSTANAGEPNPFMSYRGIEHFYGNVWQFVDGVNVQDHNVYVTTDPSKFSDSYTTMERLIGSSPIPQSSGSYTSKLQTLSVPILLPESVGGNSGQYVGDAMWSASGPRVVLVGGTAADGLLAGASCFGAHFAASHRNRYIGSRIMRRTQIPLPLE